MKIKLETWAYTPVRAHSTDAGLDLRSPVEVEIRPGGGASISTGVSIELPHGTFGKIESKSGLNVKHSIVSCGGVVDEGYSGNIVVKLYNLDPCRPYTVHKGDKIAQLIVQPCLYEPVELVEEISAGERGDSGFGSTGR